MDGNLNRVMPFGDPAPAFKVVTTQGPINFPDDYKGKWVVLFRIRRTLHRIPPSS